MHLTSAELNKKLASLDLLATIFLMQSKTPLAFFFFFATKALLAHVPPGVHQYPHVLCCFPASWPPAYAWGNPSPGVELVQQAKSMGSIINPRGTSVMTGIQLDFMLLITNH